MSERLSALADVQQWVWAQCRRLDAVTAPLDAALGCVLAADVVTAGPVPPFANTAMDGYAVHTADTASGAAELTVIATIAAGAASLPAVGAGEAARIMTGAPVPEGADAIVMVERTTSLDGGGRVRIDHVAVAGDHIRPAGDDLAGGSIALTAGTALTAAHLGVAATAGRATLEVVRPPVVGVLSTGDELVEAGAPGPLRPGQIRDSNRHALLGLVRQAGAEAIDLGIVADDEQALESVLEAAAARCDVLLTSGGVSVGDFDLVKVVLDRLSGGAMRWMQVAIRPAKPFAFGTIAGVPVFGLPGNPVSSLVSFELFARPALRTMMGHDTPTRPHVRAVADDGLRRSPDGKLHFVRVIVEWVDGDARYHARSIAGQASHHLAAMAAANALAVVADGDGIEPGGDVTVMMLGEA